MSCYGSFILNITEECNLRCVYCPVNYTSNTIDFKTAEDIVNYCLSITPNPHICFFGGEPLIAFEQIIKPLILKFSKKVSWGISTNGTLLTAEIIKFLYDNNVQILLSIDGPEYIQNQQRKTKNNKNTYEIIEKWLSIISEFFPRTIFRSTCTPIAPEGIYESYKLSIEKGFKKYYNCAEEFSDKHWTEEKKKILSKGLNKIEQYYIESLKQNQQPTIFVPLHEVFSYILNDNFINETINCERCGLGTLSLGFDIYGNIYSCNEQATYDISNPFCIGNIYNGIDNARLTNLQQTFLQTNCQKCQNWKVCKKLCCLSRRYFMFHDFNHSSSIWCFWLNEICKIANNIINTVGKERVLKFINECEYKYDYPLHPSL